MKAIVLWEPWATLLVSDDETGQPWKCTETRPRPPGGPWWPNVAPRTPRMPGLPLEVGEPLAIAAAARKPTKADMAWYTGLADDSPATRERGVGLRRPPVIEKLHAVIGVVTVSEVWPHERVMFDSALRAPHSIAPHEDSTLGRRLLLPAREEEVGLWGDKRWAWVTDWRRRLATPVPTVGATGTNQGVFLLAESCEAAVRSQVPVETESPT